MKRKWSKLFVAMFWILPSASRAEPVEARVPWPAVQTSAAQPDVLFATLGSSTPVTGRKPVSATEFVVAGLNASGSAPYRAVDLAEGLVLPEPVGVFYSWAQTGVAIMNFLIENGSDAMEPWDLMTIQSNLQRLDAAVAENARAAAEQRRRSDAQTAELQEQFVTREYSAVQTALEFSGEFPDDALNVILQLQTTADALMARADTVSGFYLMSDFPNPDRFDPRMATPTFVSAVSAWISIRAAAGFDKNSEKLHEYASHLEWVASRTSESVACWSGQEVSELPGCGGRCEIFECITYTECVDSIAPRSSRRIDSRRRLGNPPHTNSCPQSSGFNFDATRSAQANYGPEWYATVAAQWHEYADM
jgi:hypothetical protein